jgi:hypothetical protein
MNGERVHTDEKNSIEHHALSITVRQRAPSPQRALMAQSIIYYQAHCISHTHALGQSFFSCSRRRRHRRSHHQPGRFYFLSCQQSGGRRWCMDRIHRGPVMSPGIVFRPLSPSAHIIRRRLIPFGVWADTPRIKCSHYGGGARRVRRRLSFNLFSEESSAHLSHAAVQTSTCTYESTLDFPE